MKRIAKVWSQVVGQVLRASCVALFFVGSLMAAVAPSQVTLPIEIMGAEGTQVSVSLSLSAAQVALAQRLWLQTHNLRYAEKASIQINGGAWQPLNNSTATMIGTSAVYGGIGGSFAVLKMTLPVVPGQLVTGTNTLTFRFNVSNGLAVGYRIVNLNVLDANGDKLIPVSQFITEDPTTWTPPSSLSSDIAAGEALWKNADLVANYHPGAKPLQANCASCHTQNGADLKYFSYSNHSIIERAKFHGLSNSQGSQIASYIRSLPVKSIGRPWNPPYQPGPGLTGRPNDEWLAGAGIDQVLDDDADTLLALFPNGVKREELMEGDTNKFKRFSSQDTPLAFQLPDWNHWLPEVHPLDSMPEYFSTSESLKYYNMLRDQLVGKTTAQIREWMRTSSVGSSPTGVFLLSQFYGDPSIEFAEQMYPELLTSNNSFSDPEIARQIYSFVLWKMVKHVEIHEEFSLTGLGRVPENTDWAGYESRDALPRMWLGANRSVFDSSPFLSGLESPQTGSKSGSTLFNYQYLSNSWYQLQLLLNAGQRTGFNHQVVDFGYAFQFTSSFERSTAFTQMGRHYVWCLKGMDEGDNDRGPNQNDGWSFNRATLDPVGAYIAPQDPRTPAISPFSRSALSLLVQVWLEKNASWLPEQIFSYPDGTAKSGNEDGVIFNTRDWVIGSGNDEFQTRSIGQGKFAELATIKAKGTLPPALLNGYAQWAQVMWPGLDANGDVRNDWMQFSVPRVGTAPAAPTVANSSTYGDIVINWAPMGGALSYNVKRSTSPTGPFLTVAYFRATGQYTDRVPLLNREYYYVLSANTASGETPDSSAKITTLLRNRLLGTFIGTTPSSDNKTREATDGDIHSIASAYSNSAWTGLDFGSARTITRIGYIPQRAYSKRMIGGKFQASNSPNFDSNVVDLLTLTVAPNEGFIQQLISVAGSYRYVRYLMPNGGGGQGQFAEMTFWGDPSGVAAITGDPSNVSVSVGASASFAVTVSGNPPPTLVWQRAVSGSSTFNNLTNGGAYSGVTSASLTIASTTIGMSGDRFRLVATNSGGTATSGFATLTVNPTSSPAVSSVVGTKILYNQSAWDGNSAGADAADDAAIATDKQALLSGQTATFANYTSYNKGLNGVMVDIAHLPGTPVVSDFIFKIGNTQTPATWAVGIAPVTVALRAGAGVGGSSRITLIWANNAIQNTWLQVTVKATANTGLTADYVFYIGNAIGECGNSPLNAQVTASDQLGARSNPASLNSALITNVYDYNRDKNVNAADQLISRANPTAVNALVLLSAPSTP